MDNKVEYEKPTLIEVGSFEEITQGQICGSQNDAEGVANGPGGQILCLS